jgi:hypothetical protein
VRWQPYALGGLALAAIAGLIWLALLFVRPEGGGVPGAAQTNVSQPTGVEADTAQGGLEQVATGVGETFIAAGGDVNVAEAVEPAAAAAAGLPPSRNARAELGIGMRVAIVPGLALKLRSEPGAEAGVEVGSMVDGEVATIIGGPRLTQGDTDTIVWWLVQLDDGTQAWAAANTSQYTLLVPAP